ncbi:DUF2786 domain-containing protein [Agrobacterium rubi]|nr:DUF2786 domain-containing protein [Agrobacterium rubi]NTF25000.1 DUF2786 domain-containing protein [Agrobacterium rubi]
MTEAHDDKIKRRIRGLLSKTLDNGVTESEAMLAAAKAAELMEKYDIETADLEEPVEGIGAAELHIDPALSDAIWRMGNAIAELCSCRFLVYTRTRTRVEFVGYDTDRQIAVYLLEICARALKDGAESEDRRNALFRQNIRMRKRLGFIEGMSGRLDKRIRKLAWIRREKASANALVPVKMAKINDHVGDIPISTIRQSIIDDDAFKAGEMQADTIQLVEAVGTGRGHPISLLEGHRG